MKVSGKSAYLRLGEEIRKWIASDNLLPGDRLPGLTAIAAKGGVSIRTADMALQQLIRDGVCYRRPKQGTFVARQLGDGDGRQRALLLHSCWTRSEYVNSSILMSILDGAQAACAEHGIMLLPVYGDPEQTLRFYLNSKDFHVFGMIFSDQCDWQEKIGMPQEYPQMRFAWLNYWCNAEATRYPNLVEVLSDEAGGGRWAARHLWELGHRRICTVNIWPETLPDLNYALRIEGFRQEFLRLGGRLEDLTQCGFGSDQLGGGNALRRMQHGGPLALEQARKHSTRFTAVFCVEDALAAGIALADPALEVVGYDRMISWFADVAQITSVRVDYRGQACRAVARLSQNEFRPGREIIPVCPEPKTELRPLPAAEPMTAMNFN